MWQGLVGTTSRWWQELNRSLQRGRLSSDQKSASAREAASYLPLQRLTLTDSVSRTLFDEYAAHRESSRGHEETGWVLLGLREEREAVVLATLPAGAERNAGVAHVQFNPSAQALGSRMVRQHDRRLTILGVVHTHPGSLRHPSDADFRGDSQWVGQLRGAEGVFGIGTADSSAENQLRIARQPRPHMQALGKLCFSWYALKQGDAHYRPLPIGLTIGPDLARPLHPVWSTIEAHADRLDRLARQQSQVVFDVADDGTGPSLRVTLPLAEPGQAIRVLLREEAVAYYLLRGPEVLAVDPREDRVDQGVYLMLADLASQD